MQAAEEQSNYGPDEKQTTITPKGWANAPKLSDLQQDVKDADDNHRQQVNKVDGWLDNLEVKGKAKPKTRKGFSEVQPKLIRKQAEWRYASLSEPFLAVDDLFELSPNTWEDKEAARQNSLVLNNQMNTKIDKQHFIDEYVRAAVNEGTVIVKMGWLFEEATRMKTRPTVVYTENPQMAELHQELATLKESNPTEYGATVPEELQMAHDESMRLGIPMEATITGYEEYEETYTKENCPTLEICNLRNVVVDPSCQGDRKRIGFIEHSFETSIAELTKAGKYSNLDAINVDGASPLGDPDHDTEETPVNFNFKDNTRKRIVAHEYWGYWDIDGTGILKPFVATWVGDVMIRLEDSPFSDGGLPFIIVPTLPVKNSVYGEPDGELLEDNQKIIGAVTRGMIDIMGRSANGQMGVRKDALDAVNRRRFLAGNDYEFNQSVDPRQGFHMHTYPEIPQSAQYMLQYQNFDAESMSGVKAFSSNGISGSSLGDVATGIRGAIDAAGKRETGILRRLASGVLQIGRKIISMNADFLEDEEIIRITNESFIAIRREDLAGNFDIRMDISTLEEDNQKAQELAFLLQTMGPNADLEIIKSILVDICRLRKLPALAKKIEEYSPQPDPLDQEIKALTAEKLRKEIAEIEARTIKHYESAELDDAKQGTEEAKARKLLSETDQANLDFVEQESGVKQEREKELQGEQARANAKLKVLDHELKGEEQAATELQKYLKK